MAAPKRKKSKMLKKLSVITKLIKSPKISKFKFKNIEKNLSI